MTRRVAAWTVRGAAGIVALVGAAVIAVAAVMVIEDESEQGEMFDGLGTLVGLVLGGAGVTLAGIALTCVWLARRHLLGAALTLCLLGVLVAGVGGVAIGAVGLVVAAPMVLGGLLVGGLGFGAALGATG